MSVFSKLMGDCPEDQWNKIEEKHSNEDESAKRALSLIVQINQVNQEIDTHRQNASELEDKVTKAAKNLSDHVFKKNK